MSHSASTHLTGLHRALSRSTSLLVALTMCATPYQSALAQTAAPTDTPAQVDCSVDGSNPACAGVPPVEVPVVPVPVLEEPVIEAPVVEAPVVEAPVVEAPVVDAPAVEAPPEEAPAQPAEAPAVEAPAIEEAPVVVEEAPAAEPAPVVEEAPLVEAVPAEEPSPAQAELIEETLVEETTSQEEAPVEAAPEIMPEAAPAGDPAAQSETTGAEATPTEVIETEASAEPAPATSAPTPPAPVLAEDAAPVTFEQIIEASPQLAPAIVPDNLSVDQTRQIQAREERRREDARDRRNELLGAAAVGAAIGLLIPALGGTVVEDQGDRLIVERDGDYFVRRDESSLLRDGDVDICIERLRGGRTQETVTRRNGVQIITIRDTGGYVLFRSRLLPGGREIVMIDNLGFDERVRVDFDRQLPPLRLGIPQELYVVPARQASYETLYQSFIAPPVELVPQAYSLRQVRENERLRDMVRRIDLDTITFASGQATVTQSQVPLLDDIALATLSLIENDPSAVVLIEGHTDAVGSEISNLALSDRRAEAVARILTDVYGVPPENLIVQGYGEQFLKVPTELSEERNRRVTIRNITSLLGAR